MLLFIAFYLIVAPIAVLPDIIGCIPCGGVCIGNLVGDLVGGLLCCCSCMTAFVVWFVVMGFCWLFARPVIGLILLLVAGGVGLAGYFLKKKHDEDNPKDDVEMGKKGEPEQESVPLAE